MGHLVLKKGREKSLLRQHPWVFSGAVDKMAEIKQNGETIEIRSFGGETLAIASYSEHSQIVARVWTFDRSEKIDKEYLRKLFHKSKNVRSHMLHEDVTNAYRIINAEADGIPGLIVDKYDQFLVCQFLSAGAEFWRKQIVELLAEEFNPLGIFERSDSDSRIKEGLEKQTGVIFGEEPPSEITIYEGEIKYFANIKTGHKTGFYLDQRNNRGLIKEYCNGNEVLNCFSYSGGFGIVALKAGASHITNIDSSAESLKMVEKNIFLNGLDGSKSDQVEGDVFKILRTYRDSAKSFDVIVLDPPKFAESKSQLDGALRGYKDINLLAFKLLKPGGVLFTFSCSGHIVPELFRKVVSDAAIDSGRRVQQLALLQQSHDHPVLMNFPESFYLKGLICKAW